MIDSRERSVRLATCNALFDNLDRQRLEYQIIGVYVLYYVVEYI